MSWTAPVTWTSGEVLTAADMNQQLRDNMNAAFPIGGLHYFMQNGTSVETQINGFALETNGVAVSRTTYANLNTLLSGMSYPFGTGDGSTTFNLPDTRGRALYHMAASGNADVNGIGDNDGVALASRSPKHNTTVAAHTHGVGTLSATDSGHVHGPGSGTNFVNAQSGSQQLTSGGAVSQPQSATTASGTANISLSGATASTAPAGGPGGSRPTDLSPWIVCGCYAVKF